MKTQVASAVSTAGCLIAGLTGVQAIDQLDLGPIKVKLMREDGENWSLEQVNMAEKWYKRFLFLNLMHPSLSIVPTKVIDTFWHYHILDTMKYAKDCQNVFGYFLHHFPYFGMRGDEDAKNLDDAFANTKDLFHREFGEPISELRKVFAFAESEVSADCEGTECGGTACGSSNCDGKISGIDFHTRPVFLQ
ncbi:MAG: hypothetical protein AAB770_00685 [Patescibacteria group bacterium]